MADYYHLGQRLISDFDQTDYLGQREGGILTVGGGQADAYPHFGRYQSDLRKAIRASRSVLLS